MEQQEKITNLLKGYRIIHMALMGGMALFLLVTVFLTYNNTNDPSDPSIFLYLVPAVVLFGFVASHFIPKFILTTLEEKSYAHKIQAYSAPFVIRLAFLEGPGLFCLVNYLITGGYPFFLGLALLVIAYFFTKRPTVLSVAKDLSLTHEERKQLEVDWP